MSTTFRPIDFTREEFTTSLRVLLVGFCEWAEQVLTPGAIPRTVDSAQPPLTVDLSKPGSAGATIEGSLLMSRMQEVYDFATTGNWDTVSLDEFGHELTTFEALCEIPLESHVAVSLAPSIDFHRLPEPKDMCRIVLDHALARWTLLRGDDLTVGEIAILAGLAEKTIRMAANPKVKDPLITFKDGHNTYVKADEALRWLSARPGFRVTVMSDDVQHARPYTSLRTLAWQCRGLREMRKISQNQLLDRLKWSRAARCAYRQLEAESEKLDPRPLTVPLLIELGVALGISDPQQFARHAAILLAPIAIDRECARHAASNDRMEKAT